MYAMSIGALGAVAAVATGALLLFKAKSDLQRSARLARARGLLPPPGRKATDEDVRKLIAAGEKILAIKLHREIHGTGLAESKVAVERMSRAG